MEPFSTIIAGVGTLLRGLGLHSGRRIPRLHVEVTWTGSDSTGITFTAEVSETRNMVAALNVVLTATLEDVEGPVHTPAPFNLGAGELGRPIRFALERPRFGTLVKANNDAPTLYGKELTVTVKSGRHKASTKWKETLPDPTTDAAQYKALHEVWEIHARDQPAVPNGH
jgi:hypothetical protein